MYKHKILIFLVLILITGNLFAQRDTALILESDDIRFEPVFSNGATIGYYLFVRKKPEIESVMLTETTGRHALRAFEWNVINGNERRELSGEQITNMHSRFSIVSSSPRPDFYLTEAFILFIPLRVTYGNPSSSEGTVTADMSQGVEINVRTFSHRYADPMAGRHEDNIITIHPIFVARRNTTRWFEGIFIETSGKYYVAPSEDLGNFNPSLGFRTAVGYTFNSFRFGIESGFTYITSSDPQVGADFFPIVFKGGYEVPIYWSLGFQADVGVGLLISNTQEYTPVPNGHLRLYATWTFMRGFLKLFAGGGLDLVFDPDGAFPMPVVEVGISSRFLRFTYWD